MIGRTISHYRIIEKLGGGGMGIVYKAQDLKLDRYVALKFLPPNLTTSEEEKQRFIHEAKAASKLEHNNICNIHEIDETDEGQLFISMSYYEGETLDKKIKEKPLPIEKTIDIAIQIAHGLAKAHDKEIVHRDIKPANIMLTADGVVKILDFGLAKLSTQTKLTKESTTLGTVSYMSPEQAKGEKVDYRTDIWSTGVIIYEMLTGQLPFKGEYESAVIYNILYETQEQVTGLRTGVPMEMERIINKCLHKNSADRYQHFDELIVDLKGLKSEIDSIVIPSKEEKHKNRSISVPLSISILLVLILIVFGYFLIQPGEKSKTGWENSIAVLPFADLSPDKDQEYFCDGMTEQIITNLSKIERLKVIARTTVMTYKNSNKHITEIGKELNVSHILEGSIRKSGKRIRVTAQLINTNDGSHIWADDYNRELENIFDVQDDVSEAIADNLLANLSSRNIVEIKIKRPSNTEAYEYYMKGKYFHHKFQEMSKKDDFLKSENMLKAAIKLDPKYALSYAELTDLYNTYYNNYYKIEKTEEGIDKYMRLQEAYLDTAMQLDSLSSEVYYAKCYMHFAKDDLDDAIKSAKKAIKINRNYDPAIWVLGGILMLKGLSNLSIEYYNTAIEINPLNSFYYYSRAEAHMHIGEYDNAEIDLQKAIELAPDNEYVLLRYSFLLIEIKKLDKAKHVADKFRRLYPDREVNYFFEAALYALNGEKEKALRVKLNNKIHKFYLYSLLEIKEESIQYLVEDFDRVKNKKLPLYLPMKNRVFYDFLRSDHRFQEILAKHKELYDENLRKYGDIDID